MPQRIEFETRWDTPNLIKRVAEIIGFNDHCEPYSRNDNDVDWTLNASNDWWLHLLEDGEKSRKWALDYRYSKTEKQWHGLASVLEMLLVAEENSTKAT